MNKLFIPVFIVAGAACSAQKYKLPAINDKAISEKFSKKYNDPFKNENAVLVDTTKKKGRPVVADSLPVKQTIRQKAILNKNGKTK